MEELSASTGSSDICAGAGTELVVRSPFEPRRLHGQRV